MKPEDIKKVHELTGLSLSACKRALIVSKDVEHAVALLKKEFLTSPEEVKEEDRKPVC